MKADTTITITITPAMVYEWLKEAQALEADALKKNAQAKTILARVEAARLLLGMPSAAPDEEVTEPAPVPPEDPGKMIDRMETVANSSDRPLTKATMKARLMTHGFPEERMGNYFYTCVARLKAAKRITVMPDGRIWKAA